MRDTASGIAMIAQIEFPDELYHRAVAAAARLGITLDEFIAQAVQHHIEMWEVRQAASQPSECK